MNEPSYKSDRLTLLAFLVIVVLLGANFVAVRFSNAELDPFWGAAIRFGAGTAILTTVMIHRRLVFPRGSGLLDAIVYGLLNFGLSYALFYWALQSVPSGLAAVMVATLPLVTLLLAAAVRLERIGWRNFAGGVVAITGLAIIFFEPGSASLQLWPVMAVAAGIVVSAMATIYVKRMVHPNPISLNAVGMGAGTLLLLASSWLVGETWTFPTQPDTWWALGWLTMSAVVAFVLFVMVIVRWSASAANYTLVLAPIVTVLLAGWLLDERLTGRFLVGSAIAMFGAYVGVKRRVHGPATRKV